MSEELRNETRQRRRERELLAQKREEFARDLRAVATNAEGRRFLGWLLERGGIFRADYLPGVAGAYAAGKKAVALELWDRLRTDLPQETFVAIALPEAVEREEIPEKEDAAFPEDELAW